MRRGRLEPCESCYSLMVDACGSVNGDTFFMGPLMLYLILAVIKFKKKKIKKI